MKKSLFLVILILFLALAVTLTLWAIESLDSSNKELLAKQGTVGKSFFINSMQPVLGIENKDGLFYPSSCLLYFGDVLTLEKINPSLTFSVYFLTLKQGEVSKDIRPACKPNQVIKVNSRKLTDIIKGSQAFLQEQQRLQN